MNGVEILELLAIVLFALAVSGDGFIVGIAYGIKQIKIPTLSLLVIAMASALVVMSSMILGKGISCFIAPQLTSTIGASLIIIIGIYFLLQAFRQKIYSLEHDEEDPLLSLNINSLGIIIQILKKPSTADFDSSGEISFKEAFFLGLALAMDAMGAGIGMAMTGMNILLTAISVGVLKFTLVSTGLNVGRKMQNEHWQSATTLLTGLILLAIGILEYF